MLHQIHINSVDVKDYVISYEIERTFGDAISTIELNIVKTVSDVLTITEGMTIELWRGLVTATDLKIFDGYIEKYEPDGGKIKIYCKDKAWDLVRKEVTHTYDYTIDASAGKISEIFTDLVTTYGGLTADATSVQDSGSAIILQKFVCNHTDIFERCKKLAEMLGWQFYYRADTDKVYFEPKGYTVNANILTVGTEIIQIPKWNYDITEMVNDVTIVGAYQEIETTESGKIGTTAGYTTTYIDINFTPISVKVYADAGDPPTTLKVGGLPDSTGTYFYYPDKNQKKIMPATGTTFTTDWYFEIRYSHAVPIPVHMVNDSSITTYGQFKKTVTYTDIKSVADAETRGTNYLLKYSTPFIYATLKVKTDSDYSLDVGDKIKIVDEKSTPNVSSDLVINKLRYRYPSDYDEIDVGDKFWRLAEWQASVEERLKRIQEDELANQDIVTELITMDNSISYGITVRPRYRKVLYKTGTQSTDSFILGTSVLGTAVLGDFANKSETVHYIQQYNDIYIETFGDTDFKDATTDANWDTTNKWASFE